MKKKRIKRSKVKSQRYNVYFKDCHIRGVALLVILATVWKFLYSYELESQEGQKGQRSQGLGGQRPESQKGQVQSPNQELLGYKTKAAG